MLTQLLSKVVGDRVRFLPYFAVLLCGLGDVLTTWVNLNFSGGLIREMNVAANFFIPTLVLCGFLLLYDLLARRRIEGLRVDCWNILRAGVVLVALVPTINNLLVFFSI
jgi:hypothetical protein